MAIPCRRSRARAPRSTERATGVAAGTDLMAATAPHAGRVQRPQGAQPESSKALTGVVRDVGAAVGAGRGAGRGAGAGRGVGAATGRGAGRAAGRDGARATLRRAGAATARAGRRVGRAARAGRRALVARRVERRRGILRARESCALLRRTADGRDAGRSLARLDARRADAGCAVAGDAAVAAPAGLDSASAAIPTIVMSSAPAASITASA